MRGNSAVQGITIHDKAPGVKIGAVGDKIERKFDRIKQSIAARAGRRKRRFTEYTTIFRPVALSVDHGLTGQKRHQTRTHFMWFPDETPSTEMECCFYPPVHPRMPDWQRIYKGSYLRHPSTQIIAGSQTDWSGLRINTCINFRQGNETPALVSNPLKHYLGCIFSHYRRSNLAP